MGGEKNIWLGNLENTLIWQTAQKSGVISQQLTQDDGARTTRSRWRGAVPLLTIGCSASRLSTQASTHQNGW